MSNEEIQQTITEHPVGPHRRLYLLLKMRSLRNPPRKVVYCACGARVTNQNPLAKKCDHCYKMGRKSEAERLQDLRLRDLEHDVLFDGHQKRRIDLDFYER